MTEGLSVALLADDESAARYPRPEGPPAFEVGLYELNVPRFLLDNCADCDEAAALLLTSKRYVSYIPVHYLVADRHGRSFVFETSLPDGREHLMEGEGAPQVVTNHPLHRYAKEPSCRRERPSRATGAIGSSARGPRPGPDRTRSRGSRRRMRRWRRAGRARQAAGGRSTARSGMRSTSWTSGG